MAIKIRKKVDKVETEKDSQKVLEPEVLPPEGEEDEPNVNTGNANLNVQLPGMEDNFLKKSNSAMEWLLEHRRAVIGIAAFVLIVAIAVIGVQRANERAAEDDSSVLTNAFTAYTAMTKAQADEWEKMQTEYMKSRGIAAEAPDILHVEYSVPDEHTRYVGISNYLSESLPKLGDKPVAVTGQLMRAGAIARISGSEVAEPAYQMAADSLDKNVSLFGKLGKIEVLVGEKKYDEALSMLDALANDNNYASLYSYLTLEKARILEITGKTEEAIKSYTEVLEMNRKQDEQIALERLRVLTPDWSERYQKVQAAQMMAAQAAAQEAQVAQ